jgi:hexosaminidase
MLLVPVLAVCMSQSKPEQFALIPKPASIVFGSGIFKVNRQLEVLTYVRQDNISDIEATKASRQILYNRFKSVLPTMTDSMSKQKIEYRRDDFSAPQIVIDVDNKRRPSSLRLGQESYRLTIDNLQVRIDAGSPAGAFYAAQTLLQMLPTKPVKNITLPCMTITDSPRFPWRGLHLDCSRHFFTVPEIKKYLDYMSTLKLNTFHWHLIDEGGWRMEVKKYPKLTSVGAWRTKTPEVWGGKLEFPGPDSGKELYGGYYSQAQIKEIVKYAADRFIKVVPEIEMPGHILPAIWAYPNLGCGGSSGTPGAQFPTYAFCVGKESTYDFLKDVLKETMELFPSKEIHVGGDEVNQAQWMSCPDCRSRMTIEGIADAKGMQSFFMKRIEKFLNANGRLLMGWDEILDGGLAPKAQVMSWRGTEGGIEAANQGHQVVMSPTSHCYFDYGYAGTSSQKVYEFDPVPSELDENAAKLIKGGQANVWTEWIPDFSRVQYMIFPRLFAMAEVLWSPKEGRSWAEFEPRMNQWNSWLSENGINYYVAPPTAECNVFVMQPGAKATFNFPPVKGLVPMYQIDGGVWQKYLGPVPLTKPCNVIAALADNGKPSDEVASVTVIAEPLPSVSGGAPGLKRDVYAGKLTKCPTSKSDPLSGLFRSTGFRDFGLEEFVNIASFGIIWKGKLRVEQAGLHTITLGSDDGSRLYIGGGLVVDNDRLQAYSERTGKAMLVPGDYDVEIQYFDGGGARNFRMFWEAPGSPKRELSPNDFLLSNSGR